MVHEGTWVIVFSLLLGSPELRFPICARAMWLRAHKVGS